MESSNWAPEHSKALREYQARGMSYSEIADAINAKFGTCYSRNATIGRGKRMGLGAPDRPDRRSAQPPRRQSPKPSKKRAAKMRATKMRESRAAELREPPPARERAEPVKLRCVGLRPRLVSLVDLENGECRYPYGGDKEGEAILFCGHPRLAGSSYCKPHFHLTRDGDGASERAAGPVALRLVDAA
jgi:GcrA cell cycle regulator